MVLNYPALVMECPSCGRLWVGSNIHDFSIQERDELGGHGTLGVHAPALFHDETYLGHNAGFRTCGGVPESVYRSDVQAAWILGGKEAAQGCVNRALRTAIEDYERSIRTRE